MDAKTVLLNSIRQGLTEGVIAPDDIRALLPAASHDPVVQSTLPGAVSAASPAPPEATAFEASKKLSLVDVLFYLAGGVLYAALMVMALQPGGSGSMFMPSVVMLIGGLALWMLVFVLGRQPQQSENQVGFSNAMLLTGCLAMISGGTMLASQLTTDTPSQAGYVLGVAYFVLGGLHLFFDSLLRRTVLIVLGMFLFVVAFPSIIAALLANQDTVFDVWVFVGIVSGVLLAAAGRVASRTAPGREHLYSSFLSVAGFVVLGSVYSATLGSEAAVVWSIVLPLLIYVAFYISIKQHSKNFLINGSLFLVLFIITVAFKYFSGLGAAFSLLISATALLGTAFMAASINRRYIKANS